MLMKTNTVLCHLFVDMSSPALTGRALLWCKAVLRGNDDFEVVQGIGPVRDDTAGCSRLIQLRVLCSIA